MSKSLVCVAVAACLAALFCGPLMLAAASSPIEEGQQVYYSQDGLPRLRGEVWTVKEVHRPAPPKSVVYYTIESTETGDVVMVGERAVRRVSPF